MNILTKRIITIILALIMVLSTVSVFAAEGDYPFSDFPDGWSREAMCMAVDNGLLTGMGDGTIAPKSNLTRAQMAAIINRAFGAEIMADISEFTDVPEDAWYRDDIAVAVNMQTLAGEGNGIMNPESDITRQEAFAILSRALVLETNKNVVGSFTDGVELSDWAVGDVSALVANGYVSGYPDGTLDPRGLITREEFAQVMFNIFHTYISESGSYDSVNEVTGVMINTPDVTLKNVTVYGDLVLGDGVGKGSVTLENVKIKGRLLCRGGEDKVTLKNTTTGIRVVVKDVNGVVNFNNYKTETVFNGVREITRATYLNPSRPSSGGGTWPSTEYKTIKIYDDSTLTGIISTIKVKKGDLLLDKLPSAPTRPGFDFNGWYYVDNGVEKKVDSTTKVSDDIKVYAKWKPLSGVVYTVKHIKQDLDGNYTLVAGTDILSGVAGSETEAIAKVFEGFTAESFTQEVILADGTTVVEIRYSRNSYTIKFNTNGGTPVPDITALYEAPITAPADPIKVGFRFVKWYTDEALTTEFTFDKMPVGGATLYASWTPSTDIAYRVQHVKQNLDGTYTTLVETETKYGQTGNMTEAAARTYEGFTAEPFTQKTIAADGTTVVEIKYKRNSYTITFNSNGGTAVADITALYEAPITKPADPIKAGFRFVKWYTDDALTTEFVFDKMPVGGATLYASWVPSTDTAYRVKHVRQNLDGTYTTLVETETKYGTTGTLTEATARTYDGFTAESFSQKTIAADATTVVEIKYRRNSYTISFNSNGGSAVADITALYEAPITEPTQPTKTGYNFAGWFTDEALTIPFAFDKMPYVNTTLYAKWTEKTDTAYTVRHVRQNLDGTYSTLVETETKYGTTGEMTAATARTYEGFTAETFTQKPILADGTTVVEIKYSRNSYTITFNSNGGTAVADITALYEAPITAPADPIKVGFRFVKWYTDEALTTEFIFDKMPLGGATLYASWTPSTDTAYRVQHIRQNLDGTYSTLVETETKYGTTGALTEATARTYNGFTAESFTQKTIAADATTVVEIKYRRNSYTISFNSNGGSTVSDITALYEAPITEPTQPTKIGYNFAGWFTDEALTIPFTFDKMPYVNTTLYAKWTEKTDTAYTVRHVRQNLDGTYSTLVETETKYGTTGEMTEATARTYEGFSAETFAQKPILADGTTFVEIKYSRNTYTVKYYKASTLTDLISSENVLYEGTAASIPADPTAVGKVFIGWYYIDGTLGETEFNNTVPVKGDIDVYAKWTNMFDVTFYMDDTLTPPEIAVIQVDEGATITSLPSDPTKEEYIFEGWAYNDGGVEKVFNTAVTVNSNMQVYAKWRIKQYTVNFYVEYSTAPDASILERSYVADSGTTVPDSEIPDSYVYNGYVKNSSVDPVYSTEYKHKIPNEWWYYDTDSSKWTIFDDSVVIKSDIDVFDMSKNISFMVKSTKLPMPVSVTVPYNSHTRIADTFKDALYFGRNSVQYAFDNTDAYDKLLNKLANPKIGLIDSDGNILKQKLDIGIYEIIDSTEIQGEIKNYIRLMFKNGGDDLRTVLGFVSIPELVSAVGVDTIIDYVDNATLLEMVKLPAMRETLIEFMKEKFVSSTVFRDEVITSLIEIMSDDDAVMLSLAGFIRNEYNAGNPDVVDFINNTMHIPDISMIDDTTLANAMKPQVASMPEFMAIYITHCINNNDPKIDECINRYIETDMDVAFVANVKNVLVGDAKIESIINKYLEVESSTAETLILDYISSLTDTQKDTLSDKIFIKISQQDTYKNFIKAFTDKKSQFEISPENVSFLLGVANAVNSYTYEGLRDKFIAKFGKIIDLIGEETVKSYFNTAKDEYYNGAMDLVSQISADKAAGTVGTYSYKTALTFRVNIIADFLVPKYQQAVVKIKNKLQSKSQIKYDDNIYLKALVEKDMIAALFDTATEDLEHSGYKLKDDPMVYYDLLYAIVVLSDDALLYYDYVDYDTAFTKLTPYAVKVMNKFVAVVDHFDKTGELPSGINDKLSSISQIADLYSSFEDILNAVADEILASSINQPYTDENFKNQSIKAVTAAINLILNQFNEYVATGDLPFNAERLVNRISQIQAIYDKYGSDIHKVAEKLAQYNFNHVYTEGEVASYEEYVKHIYTLLNEAEDPAYSVDDLYDLVNVFFGDILHEIEYTPEYIEGTIDIDAYSAGAKGTNGYVLRFYR